jgi:TolA-binding protein
MRAAAILLTLFALAACVPPAPKAPGPEADYQRAASLIKEKRYQEAITAYRKIAAEAPSSPAAGDALFQAACLSAWYDNPRKDYAQALQAFEEFLTRYPLHARVQDARNWRDLLKTILEIKKENERLNRSIEQLKKLDIRHEERRTGK